MGKVNPARAVVCVCMQVFFTVVWVFLRSAYCLYVPHFIVSVSCGVGLALVWFWSSPVLVLPSNFFIKLHNALKTERF